MGPVIGRTQGQGTGGLNLQRKEGVVKHLLLLSSLKFQTRVLSRQRSGTRSLTQTHAERTDTGQGIQVSIYLLASFCIFQWRYEARNANCVAYRDFFLNLNYALFINIHNFVCGLNAARSTNEL